MQVGLSKKNNKGGRPKAEFKRDQQLAVMCTLQERNLIEQKAKQANSPVSVWLRSIAIKGQTGSVKNKIPKEVLLFTATLNHLAANINQLTKKHNQYDLFSDAEIDQLKSLINDVKQLATDIKNSLP
jgi:Bacterial mobilisation protein (MobC)